MAVTLRNDPKNTIYAMKILMKDKLPPINTSVIFKQQLPHSDFLVDIIQISEEDKRINILMEYMESRDLNYYRKKAGVFPEKTIRGVAAEVLVALEYLHSHNIIYKFLKP
jgi:serine/threonine protein kinase